MPTLQQAAGWGFAELWQMAKDYLAANIGEPLAFGLRAAGYLLVAGVLVDDAIVEIENIVRHMRMGKTAYQAAIDAADEIGLAVVATTCSIAAVFLPVGLMPGVSGQFFKNFGLTVVVSVLMSLAVARLAGVPAGVVKRAEAVLAKLEAGREATGGLAAGLDDLPLFAATLAEAPAAAQDALREVLAGIDPDALAPREALDALYRLKQILVEEK